MADWELQDLKSNQNHFLFYFQIMTTEQKLAELEIYKAHYEQMCQNLTESIMGKMWIWENIMPTQLIFILIIEIKINHFPYF